jgi:hypothetical protein
MDNKILLYGAIGLGAYLLLTNKKDSTNSGGGSGGERTYTIQPNQYPNVPAGTYRESELLGLGFVEYPVGSGEYFHQTQFVAPPNTDTTSPTWLNYLNTAINLGTTLYTTVTNVASAVKKMKTTEVKWDNNIVAVDLAYGYAVYRGFIDPTSNITKTAATLSIQIRPLAGNKVSIKFVRSEITNTGQVTSIVEKEGTIDFATRTLTGFDAGSISGVYMAGYCNTCLRPNYDVPVNIMGIGSTYDYMHPKAITHCFDGTYSDAGKGACSYHGGAHEIKLRKNVRDFTGKGKYAHYIPYRKEYKKNWAKNNKDRVKTL